jgi:hypothetical protein
LWKYQVNLLLHSIQLIYLIVLYVLSIQNNSIICFIAMQTYKELSLNNVQYICLVNASVLNIERTMTTKNFIIWKNVSNYLQNLVTDFSYLAWFFKYFDCMKVMNYPPSWIIEDMPQELMHESNRNLDIPPPPGIPPGIWILTFWSGQIPYIYL